MSRLTPEERRRVFEAQQRAHRDMLARAASATAAAPATPQERRRRLLKTVAIVALVGSAVAVGHVVEFHPPASLAEVFLPR